MPSLDRKSCGALREMVTGFGNATIIVGDLLEYEMLSLHMINFFTHELVIVKRLKPLQSSNSNISSSRLPSNIL